MTKGQNSNRPQKGSKIAVDPIRRMKDIQAISKMRQPKKQSFICYGYKQWLKNG